MRVKLLWSKYSFNVVLKRQTDLLHAFFLIVVFQAIAQIRMKVMMPFDTLKGTWILFQYLFLMEISILYAKIAVSEIFFSKTQF